MKRTSILLTVLLVVSLLFAVSCPNKNPTVSITEASDVQKDVTVGAAFADFSFKIEVAKGEFAYTAEGKEIAIKNLNAFDNGATTASAKATIKLDAADESTNKITSATVTISGFTAQKATDNYVALSFEIPAITDDKPVVKDVKTAITIGGSRGVKIKAISQSSGDIDNPGTPGDSGNTDSNVVSVKSSEETLTLTYCKKLTDATSVNLVLTNAKWKDDISTVSFDSLSAGITVKSAEKVTNDKTLKVTFEGTPTKIFENECTFSITEDLIEFDAKKYKLPTNGLSVTLNINVEDFTVLIIRPVNSKVLELPQPYGNGYSRQDYVDLEFPSELPINKTYFTNPEGTVRPTLIFSPAIPLYDGPDEISDRNAWIQKYDISWLGCDDTFFYSPTKLGSSVRVLLCTKNSGDRVSGKTTYMIDLTPLFNFPEESNKKVVGELDVVITKNVV